MVILEPEEVSALRLEEQHLSEDYPMLRNLISKLESLSASGQAVEISVVQPTTEWLTTHEVATMLRVSERTVRHWCEDGQIHAIRTAGARGNWRIRANEFSAPPDAPQRLLETVQRINRRFDEDPPEDYER